MGAFMPIVDPYAAPIELLLVEDNPGDIRLAQEAFRGTHGAIKLHFTSDGVEAMSFLRREGQYASSPRPDVVLLDLEMPRMNGPETLAHIRADAALNQIPVLILTAAEAENDFEKRPALNANIYLKKPLGLDAIVILLGSINDFAWLGRCSMVAN
jgi:two-component system, chemotaxis family, response regulator Rcp1